MASLKQIATQVIDALDQPFNTLLYERVKDLIIHERSLAIRRSIQKNGIDDEFKQRYIVEVIKVDKADFNGITTNATVFRSRNKIAKLVRFKNDNPFTYVGGLQHDTPFSYAVTYAIKGLDSLRYMEFTPKFTYNNGYIYLFIKGNPSLEKIAVESIIADPREIDFSDSLTAPIPYEDDMEFLISEDLISDIKLRIFSGDLKIIIPDDKETQITNEEINR